MSLDLIGFEVNAKLLGEGNASRTKVWELEADSGAADDNERFATARTQTVAMITAFKLLTGAVVIGFSIRAIFEEAAAVTIPDDANVYMEAFLTVGLNVSATKKGNHSIPAPADGMYVNDDQTTGDIDVTNPQTLTYLAFFNTPNFFRLSDGESMLSTPKIQRARVRSVGSGKSF